MWKPEEAVLIIAFFAVLLGSLVVGYAVMVPHAFADPDQDIVKQCQQIMKSGHTCYEYTPDNNTQFQTNSPPIWSEDIFTPSGSCNISGKINNIDGSCNAPQIVLSDDNQTVLKTNISVLGVVHIHTVTDHPQNYCPVSQWTWNNQANDFKIKYANYTALVIPTWCYAELHPTPSIPEFGTEIAILVLVISISSILVISRKK